jgi:diguanylate cyclase (GGDEF)-like protein
MDKKIVNFLKNVEIFSDVTPDEIVKIKDYFKLIEIKKDKIIFKEGDIGNELFIIKTGIISLYIDLVNGKTREIARFSTGDFFGEMAIFENAPRSATCKCIENGKLLSLPASNFFYLIESFPEISTKIMNKMLNITTQRLQNISEFLSDIVQWGETARRRAITDEMTGLFNRRFLEDTIEDYFNSSRNNKKPLALVMIDMDHFRLINEHYGQKTGDQAICFVADIFKTCLREKDIAARYGGDEFTIILPETNLDDAKKIAEDIKDKVNNIDFLKNSEGPIKMISLSQGVATFPDDGEDLKSVWKKADQALYKAKIDGRNRVVYSINIRNN